MGKTQEHLVGMEGTLAFFFLSVVHFLTFCLQYFVEAYQASPTPEAFWAEFSDSRGQRLKFTPIKKILLTRRTDANLVLAQQVLMEYGNDFINHFSYKLNGKLIRVTDVPTIVWLYKEKKGISCSEDD